MPRQKAAVSFLPIATGIGKRRRDWLRDGRSAGDDQKTHRLNRHRLDELLAYISVMGQDQVQCVSTGVCRAGDVLTQTGVGEHVDDVRIKLSGGVSWHAEVADDDESSAVKDDLIQHVGQLNSECRRDVPRWSVVAGDDRRLGWAIGQLDG